MGLSSGMRISVLSGVVAMFAFSGCMPNTPVRVDALSVVSGQRRNLDTKRLKLGVIFSENSRNTAAYLKKAAATSVGSESRIDDVAFFQAIVGALQAGFASVATFDSLEQAKADGVHLVAVVDVFAKIRTVSWTKTTADVGAVFLSPDGAQVASARGSGSVRIPYPTSSFMWVEASGAAVDSFVMALSTNVELGAYAARAAPPVPSAVASAPALPLEPGLPASPRPSFSAPSRPDDLAVIVGVESYSDIATKAPYAERDADAFKAHVLALGVPERNVVLLKGAKAGKASIEKYVETWLPKLAKADSRVYFYFSGHGAPDVKSGKAYLVPWDGDPNFLENTAFPLERLYAKLASLPSKRVLVALDSCFSGAGGRSVLASGARPLVTTVAAVNVPANLTVLSASAASEISGSLDDKGHGAFTYFLLQGLDAGNTTPKAIAEYLKPRVQDEARRLNRDQTPQLLGDGSWSLR